MGLIEGIILCWTHAERGTSIHGDPQCVSGPAVSDTRRVIIEWRPDRVRTNDSLYLIAKRYGTTIQALKTANKLSSDFIYPGQVLTIPAGAGSSNPSGNKGNTGNSGSSGGNYGTKYNLSQTEIQLLARLVRAEAEGESLRGTIAVRASVLNRLNDPRYPNTISQIIYQG